MRFSMYTRIGGMQGEAERALRCRPLSLPNRPHFDADSIDSEIPHALSGNVGQSHCVLANSIVGHKAERRPGAGEEWLAATKHDGAEIESILIDKTKVGQVSCQVWSANCNLPNALSLQPAY